MRQLERAILLQIIDNRWREHLYEMDYLREGIHLRGFAQIDPLVAYKNEGFTMFEALMYSIWEEFGRLIFHVEVEVAPQAQEQFAPIAAARPGRLLGRHRRAALGTRPGRGGHRVGRRRRRRAGDRGRAPATAGGRSAEQETVVKDEKDKIGRNDPCWCGSGKKYKKCHGA